MNGSKTDCSHKISKDERQKKKKKLVNHQTTFEICNHWNEIVTYAFVELSRTTVLAMWPCLREKKIFILEILYNLKNTTKNCLSEFFSF